MVTIDRPAQLVRSAKQTQAAPQRLHGGGVARGMASVRGEPGRDGDASLRAEDVARSEIFFSSTGCWV